MSLKMIDYIVDEHNIEIDSEIQKKVKVDFSVFDNYPLIVFFSISFSRQVVQSATLPYLDPVI